MQCCSHTDAYSFLDFRDVQYYKLLNAFNSLKYKHLYFQHRHKVQNMTYQAEIPSWSGHELDCFCYVFHRFLHELTLTAQQQTSSNCSGSVAALLKSSQNMSYSNRERHIPLYAARKEENDCSMLVVLLLLLCLFLKA